MIAHCVLLTQPFGVTSIVGNPSANPTGRESDIGFESKVVAFFLLDEL